MPGRCHYNPKGNFFFSFSKLKQLWIISVCEDRLWLQLQRQKRNSNSYYRFFFFQQCRFNEFGVQKCRILHEKIWGNSFKSHSSRGHLHRIKDGVIVWVCILLITILPSSFSFCLNNKHRMNPVICIYCCSSLEGLLAYNWIWGSRTVTRGLVHHN